MRDRVAVVAVFVLILLSLALGIALISGPKTRSITKELKWAYQNEDMSGFEVMTSEIPSLIRKAVEEHDVNYKKQDKIAWERAREVALCIAETGILPDNARFGTITYLKKGEGQRRQFHLIIPTGAEQGFTLPLLDQPS